MILTTRVNIAGTEYPAGTDITEIATDGEIASLRTAGVVRSQPERPAAKPAAEPASPPEDVVPALVIPEQVIPEPGDDWRSLHVSTFHPDNALPEGSSVTLDADVVDLLIASKLATLGQLSDHLKQHGHFRGIRGIGKATSPKIEAALQTFLAGLQ